MRRLKTCAWAAFCIFVGSDGESRRLFATTRLLESPFYSCNCLTGVSLLHGARRRSPMHVTTRRALLRMTMRSAGDMIFLSSPICRHSNAMISVARSLVQRAACLFVLASHSRRLGGAGVGDSRRVLIDWMLCDIEFFNATAQKCGAAIAR